MSNDPKNPEHMQDMYEIIGSAFVKHCWDKAERHQLEKDGQPLNKKQLLKTQDHAMKLFDQWVTGLKETNHDR